MRPYAIHHRKISLSPLLMESENMAVFREEEDQGYYLQQIVPYLDIYAIGVFRRDLPDNED